MDVQYPPEWDELPKKEKKKKIRELKKQQISNEKKTEKVRNLLIALLLLAGLVMGYRLLTQKPPEQAAFQEEVKEVSLEGRVEEFEEEGREHVGLGTKVEYKTNPPTSGSHYGEAESWGVYDEELVDEAVVHSLEHGGMWVSYKDISEDEIALLEEIGRDNPQSVVVSPRAANDDKIAVVSWGRLMRLDSVDKALIQKYIDTYKNQSPEKLAR